EDPEALAEAIAGVLAGRLRPDLDAARTYAAAFTPRRIARRYGQDYRRLVAGGQRLTLDAGAADPPPVLPPSGLTPSGARD
ncbi:MAG: hypothetical protein H0V26_01460, partial [Solirubrobacterales bacterium]|nr:hypothetical protein [Solirubrobacterales bacterium]